MQNMPIILTFGQPPKNLKIMAPKIMKNDVLYMGVKKLLVLGGWQVGWGWGGGNQLWDHHHCVWLKKS